jgi:hypothetical protein
VGDCGVGRATMGTERDASKSSGLRILVDEYQTPDRFVELKVLGK